MGVGIETSVGNPSNVGLKVPVHVAQGSCEVFTEPHLLHTYKPIHLPSGLVISQHLCTLHTHTHIQSQNLERGSSVLSSISCSTKWDLLHNKCHNCLLTAGTRSFKWFRLLHGIIAERLSARLLIVQCSRLTFVCIYIYICIYIRHT